MTRDEILNMPAGREMDALIAKQVMGLCPHYLCFDVRKGDDAFCDYITWACKHCQKEFRGLSYGVGYNHPELENYSTDIAPAWRVAEKKRIMISPVLVTCSGYIAGVFMGVTGDGKRYMVEETINQAPTAPLAICRAALLDETEAD